MFSSFGMHVRTTVFGESHGVGIGVVIDGLPAGEAVDLDVLQRFLARRAPGQKGTTPRVERDRLEFISGLVDGKLTGSAVSAIIRNSDQRSDDYILDIPRPGHADLTVEQKFGGHMDMRGSGPFSGRLTAPLCIAGGIAKQLLERRGITVGAHLAVLDTIRDEAWDPVHVTAAQLNAMQNRSFPTISERAEEEMLTLLEALKEEGDSCGGIIRVVATGVPAGLGEPNYKGVESHLAQLFFAVPGMRGLSFGDGFAAVGMRGSEHNDPIRYEDGRYSTDTNHAGGVNGGITNGMPIVVTAAMKPTSSIAKPQNTVSFTKKEPVTLEVKGRHDPAIAVRAVPVLEAALALVILDFMEGTHGIK